MFVRLLPLLVVQGGWRINIDALCAICPHNQVVLCAYALNQVGRQDLTAGC